MTEAQTLQNIIGFMDRVTVTGRQEVQAYADCVNYLEEKLAKETKTTPLQKAK